VGTGSVRRRDGFRRLFATQKHFPLVEAMAAGVATITSHVSEVAGDAAEPIDPLGAADLAAAIAKMMIYGELRTELAASNRKRPSSSLEVLRMPGSKERGAGWKADVAGRRPAPRTARLKRSFMRFRGPQAASKLQYWY
jgi:hypothetical protein